MSLECDFDYLQLLLMGDNSGTNIWDMSPSDEPFDFEFSDEILDYFFNLYG